MMLRITTVSPEAGTFEEINADLLTALDEILCDGPQVSTPTRRSCRLGLPARRRPAPPPTALSTVDAVRIGAVFDKAVHPLLCAASQRVVPYPTAELRHMNSFTNKRPGPGEHLPHLRRFALAILAVLDLLGDDE